MLLSDGPANNLRDMSDVNWFFSACAQTAGAIVAIVGGFLVTRLVSISSERTGLLQSLRAANRRLQVAQEKELKLKKKASLQEERRFRDAIMPDIVEKYGCCDFELLLEQHYGFNIKRDRMRQIAEDVSRSVRDAVRTLSSLPDRDLANHEFEEIALRLGDTLVSKDRDIYEEVFRKRQQIARDKMRDAFPYIPNIPNISPVSLISQVETLEEVELRRQLNAAKDDVARAELEKNTIREHLQRISTPKGLLPAWVILLYLSIVGVAIPLALLPAGACAVKWRTPVLVLVLIGIAALLVYFVRVICRIGDHDASE